MYIMKQCDIMKNVAFLRLCKKDNMPGSAKIVMDSIRESINKRVFWLWAKKMSNFSYLDQKMLEKACDAVCSSHFKEKITETELINQKRSVKKYFKRRVLQKYISDFLKQDEYCLFY